MSDDQKLIERLSGRRELDRDRPETVLIAKPDLRRLLALARKGLEADKRFTWLEQNCSCDYAMDDEGLPDVCRYAYEFDVPAGRGGIAARIDEAIAKQETNRE